MCHLVLSMSHLVLSMSHLVLSTSNLVMCLILSYPCLTLSCQCLTLSCPYLTFSCVCHRSSPRRMSTAGLGSWMGCGAGSLPSLLSCWMNAARTTRVLETTVSQRQWQTSWEECECHRQQCHCCHRHFSHLLQLSMYWDELALISVVGFIMYFHSFWRFANLNICGNVIIIMNLQKTMLPLLVCFWWLFTG